MTLVDYWDVIRRRLGLIAFVVLLGGLAVLIAGRPSAPGATTYGGSALLALKSNDEPSRVLFLGYVAQQTSAIVDVVAAKIDPSTYGGADVSGVLAGSISTTPDSEIGVIRIDVGSQPSQELATEVLTLYGQAIIDFAADAKMRERDDALSTVDARIASLEEQISAVQDQLKAKGGAGGGTTSVDDPLLQAQLTTLLASHSTAVAEAEGLRTQSADQLSPVGFIGGPRVTASVGSADPLGLQGRLALGLLLGLLLGIGLAFAVHRFDRRVYNRRDAEKGFQLPVLAEIPIIPYSKRRRFQLIAQQEPTAPASEAYRILRSSVDHARARQLHGEVGKPARGTVVLVTSASERVGKSTTVANLAVASVYAGKRVLIVAADLRRPTVHQFFRVENGPGLADFVDDRWRAKRTELSSYVQSTVVPDVSLIHHGREVISAGETVAAASPLIDSARNHFDIVFIDSPSMQAGSDVNELVGVADLVLLVCRIGRSTTDDGEFAYDLTERLQAPTCGLALVGVRGDLRHSVAVRLLRAAAKRMLGSTPNASRRHRGDAAESPAAGALVAPNADVSPPFIPATSDKEAPAGPALPPAEPKPVEKDPYGTNVRGGAGQVTMTLPAAETVGAPPAWPERPRARNDVVDLAAVDNSSSPSGPSDGSSLVGRNGEPPPVVRGDTQPADASALVVALDFIDEDEPGPRP